MHFLRSLVACCWGSIRELHDFEELKMESVMPVQIGSFLVNDESLRALWTVLSLRGRARLLTWVETCADYYVAAAKYEELCGLSDAELHRRGLSRTTLAWDLCQQCHNASG